MNKDEPIAPKDWVVRAVKLHLAGYNLDGEDSLLLIATDKDDNEHQFTVNGEAMKMVALEAYRALNAGYAQYANLRITNGGNQLYTLYI
ncbi:hypothetical protein DMX11_21405 [Pseudomonas sp. LB-090624]|uniref:hypothetical protein n=1 Tax=Pseudomonas sp. LB-090624 TaxID=2213079 RepID=UPI000D926566|nr:hypothetical protein [Pseudomonas sp. LB-090624]PYB70620.1 hypothetical protein DMX11_21405 [Pseudomonas sp. LB-090624]